MFSWGFIAPQTDTLSVLLGYCSIACWLGAQFPQIIANIRAQSVEGLALPFLASWLVGDITNLAGCILTDQLPFQTYLATYFCFVDVCLVAQFFYYSDIIRTRTTGPRYKDVSVAQTPAIAPSRIVSPTVRYRAIHNAASNIAVAAASAAYEYEHEYEDGSQYVESPSTIIPNRRAASMSAVTRSRVSRSPSTTRRAVGKGVAGGGLPPGRTPLPKPPMELDDGVGGEEADEVPAMMHESLHSEDGGRRGTWSSATRRPPLNLSMSSTSAAISETAEASGSDTGTAEASSTSRGRALTRQQGLPLNIQTQFAQHPEYLGAQDLEAEADLTASQLYHRRATSAKSPSGWGRSTERGSVSRRSATIVFLGVWTLFGISGWSSGSGLGVVVRRDHPKEKVGRVLPDGKLRHDKPEASPPADASSFIYSVVGSSSDSAPRDPDVFTYSHHDKKPPRSNRLIIGRISAWLCTTLYLTSRLPQIWKNFARKSVAGLSISLFVAAFLGNAFYVTSILSNPILNAPAPIRTKFIQETLPYLLGSGGTLLFDITIVSQSFIYKGRKPRPSSMSVYSPSIHRRSLVRRATLGTEEERLLASSTLSEGGGGHHRSISRKGYGTGFGEP